MGGGGVAYQHFYTDVTARLICNLFDLLRQSEVSDRSVSVQNSYDPSDLERCHFQADLLITLTPLDLERPNSTGRMWTGRISSWSAMPLPQGGPKCNQILEVPLYLCIHPLMQNYQFHVVAYRERGLVFRWSATPLPKGAGSRRSPFLGYLLFMSTSFVAELPNLTW